MLSRALLRNILSQHVNSSPEYLRFGYSSQGKPYLKTSKTIPAFNLSHSGDWIALGLADCESIGIDIEHPQKKRSFIDIAESFFHPEEVQVLLTLKDEAQIHYFHSLWTLKESFFKARGTGITEGLKNVVFNICKDKINTSINPVIKEDKAHWKFKQWRNPVHAMEATSACCYLAVAMKGASSSKITLYQTLPTVYCEVL